MEESLGEHTPLLRVDGRPTKASLAWTATEAGHAPHSAAAALSPQTRSDGFPPAKDGRGRMLWLGVALSFAALLLLLALQLLSHSANSGSTSSGSTSSGGNSRVVLEPVLGSAAPIHADGPEVQGAGRKTDVQILRDHFTGKLFVVDTEAIAPQTQTPSASSAGGKDDEPLYGLSFSLPSDRVDSVLQDLYEGLGEGLDWMGESGHEVCIRKSPSYSYNPLETTVSELSQDCYHKGQVLAAGIYERDVGGNGWHYLRLKTQPLSVSPEYRQWVMAVEQQQKSGPKSDSAATVAELHRRVNMRFFRTMEALGFLEGYSSCRDISYWYINFYSSMFEGAEPDPQVVQFVQNNYLWVLEQADRLWTQDIYWMELKGILRQINGTVRGLEEGCPAQFGPNADPKSPLRKLSVLPLTLMKMLLMNANGDLFQIVHKFTAERYYHDHRQHPISSIRNETREWIEDALHDTLEDVGLFRGKGKKGKSSPIRKLASESLRKRRHENPAAEGLEGLTKEHRQELVATTNGDRGKKSPKKSQRHQSNRRQLRALGKFPGRPYGSTSGEDHCSALIKILPDGSDVVFGHDTWDDFQNAAPRIIKYYQQDSLLVADWPLPYVSAPDKENKAESRTGNRMSTYFSSSPGFLSSVDDFYLISDRHSTDKKLHEKDHFLSYSLAVMETSIDVYDDAILELVTEKSVLSWMRARIANAQSKDGLSWSQTFSRYESGTYINQWMILDMLKFKPNSSSGVSSDTKVKSEAVEGAAVEASHSSSGVQEGFLYVLEEVPGYIHFADLSQVLIDKGYWASYNDPYFPDIRSLSGYQAKCDQGELTGDKTFCYDFDVRAKLFAEHQEKVKSLEDLQWLLQLNDITDEISGNDSCNAIACRQDLEPDLTKAYPFGAIDGKVSSVMRVRQGINYDSGTGEKPSHFSSEPLFFARMGPTSDGVPLFCWDHYKNFSAIGHPQCFDYDWQMFPPTDTLIPIF